MLFRSALHASAASCLSTALHAPAAPCLSTALYASAAPCISTTLWARAGCSFPNCCHTAISFQSRFYISFFSSLRPYLPPRSKTRSFALLALLFSSISSAEGRIGFLVTTFPMDTLPQVQTGNSGGQIQGFSFSRKAALTILSSKEWNVMMQSLPPGFNISMKSSSEFLRTSSSRLHSMRMA